MKAKKAVFKNIQVFLIIYFLGHGLDHQLQKNEGEH